MNIAELNLGGSDTYGGEGGGVGIRNVSNYVVAIARVVRRSCNIKKHFRRGSESARH